MNKLKEAGFMFIEILLALAIIMFILFKILDFYFKKSHPDKDTRKLITEQGISTSNPQSIIGSTRDKIEDIQKQHLNELDNIK